MASVSVSVAPGGPHQVTRGATAATVLPGWLLTASNTGLAGAGLTTGDLTTYSGSSTITTTVTRKIITGAIVLGTGGNLVECQITGTGGGSIATAAIYITGSDVSITNCDIIDPSSNGDSTHVQVAAFDGRTVTITSVNCSGATVPLWLNCAGTVTNWYSHDNIGNGGTPEEAHIDGFTTRGGESGLTITNSAFVVNVSAGITGAAFLQPWMDTIANVEFSRCYFEAESGYVVAIEDCDSVTFDDNRMNEGGYGSPVTVSQGGYGDSYPTNLTWTNNYLWANTPGNDYKGTAVTI